MMKIGIVTHNYPSKTRPYLQPFIRDQFRVLTNSEKYNPSILVPTPYVIPFTKRWKSDKSQLLDSSSSVRFKYCSVPRRMAPGITGRSLGRNLLRTIKEPIDILHIHWLYPNGLAIPRVRKSYRCILNIHGTDWHSTKNDSRFSSLIPKILHSAHAIIVSGNEIKKELLAIYPDLKVRVSYNYIDTDLFTMPDLEMQLSAKQRLNFDIDKTHILTVANIRPEKGIDQYLEAISNLLNTNLIFHIIGQPASGSYANKISELLRSKQLDNVIFHSPIERDNMPEYYHAADAYFLPSRTEGFNVSLLESLSTGLFTISTRTGGAKSVLNNDRGLLVEPGNISEMTDALRLLSEKKTFERSIDLRSYILKNYSLHHYSVFLDELYSEIKDSPLK